MSYYSVVYGIDRNSVLITVDCESGFKHDGLFGDNGKAYGIAQFHKPTFEQYCPDLDYTNMQDQLQCLGRMFSIGQQSHWTCYKQ